MSDFKRQIELAKKAQALIFLTLAAVLIGSLILMFMRIL